MLSLLVRRRGLRRAVALAACVGVLGWTLLAAAHRHDAFGVASTDPGGQHCLLCLGSPTGATPPDPTLGRLPPPSSAQVASAPVVQQAPTAPPSPYLSRGPPA
jgi:hypothetical protein